MPSLKEALALQCAGRNREAERLYRQTLATDPGQPKAWNNLGTLLAGLGRWTEAVDCFRQATALAPGYVGAWYNLASAQQAGGRIDEALANFRHALELGTPTASLHNANALQDAGEREPAAEHYRRALQLRPDHLKSWYNLGHLLAGCCAFGEAAECFERILVAEPDDAAAHFGLSMAHLFAGELVRGWPHYE